MVSALILIVGHLTLMVGLRCFFGMCDSASITIQSFLRSSKFKWAIVFYFIFVTVAIVGPMMF
ncbi:hypothetical protein BGC07_05090 [Piscirickettsia litoralis]|uniref:Uncharacterized protein n=1 Tax=Piscirickettsia litoralis TaxID=1891921 RepID=A0ABX3A0P1_9GAMM|nr:hypothetical protein BGC07_05090 [Piscirickettsia litoralis]